MQCPFCSELLSEEPFGKYAHIATEHMPREMINGESFGVCFCGCLVHQLYQHCNWQHPNMDFDAICHAIALGVIP